MKNLVGISTFLLLLTTCLATAGMAQGSGQKIADVLERSRAKYAALKSYADTGSVTTEYKSADDSGPATVERHTFTTYYVAPRQFFFEFVKDPKIGEERYVIWADETNFNTWWSETQVHDTYPKGQGANAFALATYPTKGSLMQISPLLFAESGLHGSTTDLKVLRSDETEEINKHRCFKVVGEVALAYGTGAVTSVRSTTIWIDADSLLIRKVLEDTPKTTSGIDRVTTTFEPDGNPKIDNTKFKFNPPQGENRAGSGLGFWRFLSGKRPRREPRVERGTFLSRVLKVIAPSYSLYSKISPG